MGQPIQVWKAAGGERAWLSSLIDAMERTSRPELRSKPCDAPVLARFRAQLALPAAGRFVSPYSLRN